MTPLNLLIAFPYFKGNDVLLRKIPRQQYRLIIDSGAFTAWNTGKPIHLDDYCRFLDSIEWLRPFHAVQLDVFGQPEASFKNLRIMQSRGYDVMPVFTRGESLELLEEYYRMTDYIMFGGIVIGGKNEGYVKWFLNKNKGRKCHWLGFVNIPFMKKYKPESVDSSSWSSSARFGNLGLYMGAGKIKTFNKYDFKRRPKKEILDGIHRVGLDESHARFLAYEESWSGAVWTFKQTATWNKQQTGMSQFVSTCSHLLRANEVERNLGTKVYLAGNNPIVNAHLFMAQEWLIEKGIWI